MSSTHTPAGSVEQPVVADCSGSFAIPNIPQPGLKVKAHAGLRGAAYRTAEPARTVASRTYGRCGQTTHSDASSI